MGGKPEKGMWRDIPKLRMRRVRMSITYREQLVHFLLAAWLLGGLLTSPFSIYVPGPPVTITGQGTNVYKWDQGGTNLGDGGSHSGFQVPEVAVRVS